MREQREGFVVYFSAIKTIYGYQKENHRENIAPHAEVGSLSLRQVVVRYALFALVIIDGVGYACHFRAVPG